MPPVPSPAPSRTPHPVPPARHHLPAAPPRHALGFGLGLLLVSFLAAVLLRLGGRPFFQGLDDHWAASVRGPAEGFVLVLDRLGGPIGLVLPLGLIGGLCVYGRWRSGLFAFTVAVGANLLAVLPLKALADRPRPPYPAVLVNDGSYPSGQVFSAVALVFVVAVLAFPPRARRWWWPVGGAYVLAMMASRVWLHAQWLTDTFAGLVLGLGVCLVLWRAFAPMLEEEARRMASGTLWL